MRGFFSALVIAVVTFLLFYSVASVFSIQARENAMLTELREVKVGERLQDAEAFFNKTIVDAIADDAFARCGGACVGGGGVTLAARMGTYFTNSVSKLSGDGVAVSYSSLAVSNPSDCASYSVSTGYRLLVNSGEVNATRNVADSRQVDIVSDSTHIKVTVSDYPRNVVIDVPCS